MSAKNFRIVGILFGVVMLFTGFKAKRKCVRALMFILGVFQIAGNLLADNKVYENVEAQINEQVNKGVKQL